jgi:hypothetical protein
MVRILVGAMAIAMIASSAQAIGITGGITEGKRDQVDGTVLLGADAPPGTNGVNVGTLGLGDVFGIYGRLVGSKDRFEMEFAADAAFRIIFDFDGYTTGDGANSFTTSGLVKVAGGNVIVDPVPEGDEKGVTFRLIDLNDGNAVIGTEVYNTNVTGGDPLIFAAGPGNYTLEVDGTLGPKRRSKAFYDLNIVASVPLPAPFLLMVGAFGALGFAARRREKQTA